MTTTRRHGPVLALAVAATVSFAAAPAALATGTTEPPAGTEPPADSAGATTPDDDLTIGFVTHVVGNPFIQQIIDAAEFAAEDRIRRTPEEVRGLLSAYHRGVQRGRLAGGDGDPPERPPTKETRA